VVEYRKEGMDVFNPQDLEMIVQRITSHPLRKKEREKGYLGNLNSLYYLSIQAG
jgi:hypothetical protein